MLKEYYTDELVEDMQYKKNPLHALLPKFTEFFGKNLPIPIIYGSTQGGSANFATAVANKGNSQTKEFFLTRISDYALASIGREVMKASESDKGAFMEAAKVNIDGAIMTATRQAAIMEYRGGTGSRGQISAGSSVGTATITLADTNSITNFEANMYVQCAATDGAAPRTGTAQILAVDRNAGTITFTGNLTAAISAAAASDYLLRAGDSNAVLSGVSGWIPPSSSRSTTAGVDSWFLVDRFADWSRLGGVFHDGTSQSIEEALMDGQSKVAREGGTITHAFMNNVQYRQLLKSLSSKVYYQPTKVEANARIAFSGIMVEGDAGPFAVIPDQNCPSKVCHLMQMDTWKLYSLGPAVHIFDKDTDQEMLRESSTDGYELRVGGYQQVGCRAPGWNGRIELAPAV